MTATIHPVEPHIAAHETKLRHRVVIEFDATRAGAIARRDRLSDAIVTSDVLPYFERVHVSQPEAAPAAGTLTLTLDAAERHDLMAALMDAIEYRQEERPCGDCELGEPHDDHDEDDDSIGKYRALSDKLLGVIRAALG